ncbi:MAG: pilus assembly protein PilP [Thermodesulfobacteriota bacterium]
MSRPICKRLAIFLFVIILPMALVSCGGDEAANSDNVRATVKMPRPKKVVKKKAEKKTVKTVAVSKNGAPVVREALRNPFQSYMLPAEVIGEERVRGPLECCEIGLFRLMAVISGIDNPRALIMAPDGKKYITKKGDLIGLKSGKIVKIAKNKIVVEERFKDSTVGKVVKEFVEIKLPSSEDKKR